MTHADNPHADTMVFCVWVINGITENDSKALFMYNCVLEVLREER